MTQLVNFQIRGQARLGVVSNEQYIDVNRALAALLTDEGRANGAEVADGLLPSDPLKFLQGGDATYAELRRAVDFAERLPLEDALAAGVKIQAAETKILVPLQNPPKIICVARNFAKHAKEANLEISEIPILFARFANTMVAHNEEVIVPKVSDQVDWEGELAFVVGKGGRHITRENAMDHVAGYTVFNDVSVRDYQFRVTQYTGGKNFQASGPTGPYLVLTDENIDPNNLDITTTINGEVMQHGNTDEFIFDIPTIIEHISEFIALEPGDIIPMGTPAGVGFKRTPPIFLKHGDVVEVTVEKIGTLTNPVRDEVDSDTF